MRGVRAHVRVADAADGSPVVFVHGIGVSGRYLVPTAVRLASHCRVYVPDLPGFGRSTGHPRTRTLETLTEALAEWLDVLELKGATFVGNSFGCQLIVQLAVTRPECVGRAVLVGPTVDVHARTFPRQLVRLALDTLREPLGLKLLVAWDYVVFTARGTTPAVRSMLRDRIEDKLPHVQAPTLVVRGSRDAIVSQRWAEEVTALLPRGRLVVVPGAPHDVNYAAADELARLVLAFVRGG